MDLSRVAGLQARASGVFEVQPYRIGMADLKEPFGVGGSRVNQRRQEWELSLIAIYRAPIVGAGDVAKNGMLRPASWSEVIDVPHLAHDIRGSSGVLGCRRVLEAFGRTAARTQVLGSRVKSRFVGSLIKNFASAIMVGI